MTAGKEHRTTRLVLRPLHRAHLDYMLPLISAREVAATTLRIPHPYTREDAEQYFKTMEAEIGKGGRFADPGRPFGASIPVGSPCCFDRIVRVELQCEPRDSGEHRWPLGKRCLHNL